MLCSGSFISCRLAKCCDAYIVALATKVLLLIVGVEASFDLTYTMSQGNLLSTSANKGTSLLSVAPHSGLSRGTFIVATCCQHRSSTRSVINVGPAQLTMLATVDGQFVASSVCICLQHDAHEAARRTGSSATADTCSSLWMFTAIALAPLRCHAFVYLFPSINQSINQSGIA